MLLGSALDPNDPFTSMLMAGSEHMPQPYSFNPSQQKPRSFNQAFEGMSATLAPSALDMSPRHQTYQQPAATMSAAPASTPAFLSAYDGAMADLSKNQAFMAGTSSNGSGTATPGGIDGGWDSFINDTSWVENAT